MFQILSLIFILLSSSTPPAANIENSLSPAVDISGHWEGSITQDMPNGTRVDYEMEVDITQKKKVCTGIAYVHFEKKYHAQMDFKGKFTKDLFLNYDEQTILKYDQIPNSEWCIKKADLIYKVKDMVPTLEGLWEGKTSFSNCIPGRIYLKKQKPKV
jgi:hypothetical protein